MAETKLKFDAQPGQPTRCTHGDCDRVFFLPPERDALHHHLDMHLLCNSMAHLTSTLEEVLDSLEEDDGGTEGGGEEVHGG